MPLQDLSQSMADGDEIEVDFEDEEEAGAELEVEVVDDRPEEDQREPVDLDSIEHKEPSKEELQGLSENVRQHLRHLKWQANEERRQREDALRREAEAFRVAKALKERNDLTSGQLRQYQKAVLEQSNQLNSSNLQAANAEMAKAYEEGDPAKIAEAQAKLTRAVVAESRTQDQSRRFQAQQEQQSQDSEARQGAEGGEQASARQPSPRAQEWGRKNPWFGNDPELTSLAYGIHEKLVIQERVQPDSDEYYQKLDARLNKYRGKGEFTDDPDAAADQEFRSPRTRSRSPVAPTGRSNGAAPKGKVTLTRSQKATADRLGIPYKRYALEVLKMEARS